MIHQYMPGITINEVLEKELVISEIEKSEYAPKIGTYHVSVVSSTTPDSMNRIIYERRVVRDAVKRRDYNALVEFYTEPDRLQMLKYAIRGTNIHNFIEEIFADRKDILLERRKSITVKSKFVPGRTFIITGKYDMLDKNENCIYELKSITGGGFRLEVKTRPKINHVIQANANAFINDIPKFKIVYINCETLETRTFEDITKRTMFIDLVRCADIIFHAETSNRETIDESLLKEVYGEPEIVL